MKPLTLLAGLWLLSAVPAFAIDVTVDFDHEFEFGKVSKIVWGTGGTPAPSELMEQRIRTAIEKELKEKGLVFVPEDENPDLQIVTHAAVDKEAKGSGMRIGLGIGRSVGHGAVSVGTSTGAKTKVVEIGSLLIEMFDRQSNALIWQATATDTLKSTPEKNTELINKAVQKAFKKFPPGAKKK